MKAFILIALLLLSSILWILFIENPPKTGSFVKTYAAKPGPTSSDKEWYKVANFSIESGGYVTLNAVNST